MVEGGCFCGAIRYRITSPFAAAAACHCRKCQYGSGGGPNYSALVAREAFELVAGEPVEHGSTGDSGGWVVRAFCGACGTPLYSDPSNLPLRVVRVGSLDDPSELGPQMHIWMDSAPPWHAVAAGAAVFGKGPGSR